MRIFITPTSPAQAILWKCWRRTRLPLLLVTLGVVALLIPLLEMNVIVPDIANRNEDSRWFVFGGLFVLWAACPGITYSLRNRLSGVGFIFYEDYVRPIATPSLVFIPLIYLCLLAIIAYLIPTIALWIMFGLAPPSITAVLIILEVTLLWLAAQWIPTKTWMGWASWLALLFLTWLGWIIPEGITTDAEGALVALPVSAYLKPGVIVVIAMVLLYRSVHGQRSGEFFGDPGAIATTSPIANLRLANYFSFLRDTCPTASPLRAAWWRERQVRGFANHIAFGFVMAVCALLTIYLLKYTITMDTDTEIEQIVAMSFAWFLTICIFTPITMFDVSLGEKNPRISVFTRTQPMGTAPLVALKVAVTISGLIVSALVMLLTILLLGPLFVADFYGLVDASWQNTVSNWPYAWPESVARSILFLIFFTSFICIYAAITTWLFVNSRHLIWCLIAIPVYGILVFVLLTVTTEPASFATTMVQTLVQHLWLLLVGLPLATAYFFKGIIHDRVLTLPQIAIFGIAAIAIWVLHYCFTLQENIFAPSEYLALAAADTLQGLLPVFAVALALWTFNRVRHA